jgi:hypothetical protein
VLPEFDEDGDLPMGIHAATLAEIEERFGQFAVSDRRMKLFVRLRQIAELASSSGIIIVEVERLWPSKTGSN